MGLCASSAPEKLGLGLVWALEVAWAWLKARLPTTSGNQQTPGSAQLSVVRRGSAGCCLCAPLRPVAIAPSLGLSGARREPLILPLEPSTGRASGVQLPAAPKRSGVNLPG